MKPNALHTYFVLRLLSMLDAVWTGLSAAQGRRDRAAAAACYQDVLLYALLTSEKLLGSSASDTGPSASGPAVADAVAFCRELLQHALSSHVLPAAVRQDSPARDLAAGDAPANGLSPILRLCCHVAWHVALLQPVVAFVHDCCGVDCWSIHA